MPYKWIDPDVCLEYNDVKIYHCYKNDNYEDVLTYHFSTSSTGDIRYDFDVRDLAKKTGIPIAKCFPQDESIVEVLRAAIEQNLLELPE